MYYNVRTYYVKPFQQLEQHVEEDVLTTRLLSWINEIQFVLNTGRIFRRILCILCGAYLKVQKIQSKIKENEDFLNKEII